MSKLPSHIDPDYMYEFFGAVAGNADNDSYIEVHDFTHSIVAEGYEGWRKTA